MTATRRGRRASVLVPAGVALITLVAFLPVLHDGFVAWDDDKNFVDNPLYRGLGPAQLHWMWTTFHMGHYVPLSWMTLGLDYELWGMNPSGYHLTNLLLHTASAVVVYFVARRLMAEVLVGRGARLTAAFAALLFAVHPLRVESVAWVTERRDVLSGLFYFSSILAYLRWRDASSNRRWYVAALALFAAALLSKATSMTLPAVLLIIDVYPLRRIGGAVGWWSAAARRVYAELAPFAVLAAGTAALSIVALHPPAQLDFSQKLAVSAYSLLFYVWKTIAPTGLSPLYEMPQHVDATAARYVAGSVFTVALVAAAWLTRRRWPGASACVAAFVVVTMPMLGVVQNGPQISADRYTYLAAPALAMLAAGALWSAVRFLSPQLVATGGSIIVLALSSLTWSQSTVWRDSKTLWSRVLDVDSTSSIAQSAMANVLYRENDVDAGIEHSRRAIEIAPGYAEAYNGLGVGLARQGKDTDAIAQYEKALELKPVFDDAENNLGIVLARQGDVTAAIQHYERALEINPGNSDAQVNWGNALVRLNRPQDAIVHYEAALRLRPENADAHHNWGVALARQGKFDEAIDHFRAAIALDSAHVEAKEYLTRATALKRQQEERLRR